MEWGTVTTSAGEAVRATRWISEAAPSVGAHATRYWPSGEVSPSLSNQAQASPTWALLCSAFVRTSVLPSCPWHPVSANVAVHGAGETRTGASTSTVNIFVWSTPRLSRYPTSMRCECGGEELAEQEQ